MSPAFRDRRHCWLMPHEPLVCPAGHRIKHNTAILQQGALICQHRATAQGECGLRVYILAMPYGLRFVAEVTTGEMLAMRDAAMTVEQVLSYLRSA